MKRITALLLVLAFAGVIVLPSANTVNTDSTPGTSLADGTPPVPPWPPCVFDQSYASTSV